MVPGLCGVSEASHITKATQAGCFCVTAYVGFPSAKEWTSIEGTEWGNKMHHC